MTKAKREYSPQLRKLIFSYEGSTSVISEKAFKSKDAETSDKLLNSIHPKSQGKAFGAYWDTKGLLTTGKGYLIVPEGTKRGSQQEAEAIAKFTKVHGYSPFDLSEEQSDSLMDLRLDENIGAYLRSKNGAGVDYDTMPPEAQSILASMAYNMGGSKLGSEGITFSKKLKTALASKKSNDWKSWQKEVKDYHIANSKIERGIVIRRDQESKMLDALVKKQSIHGADYDLRGPPTPTTKSPVIHTIPEATEQNEASSMDNLMNALNPLGNADASDEDEAIPKFDAPQRGGTPEDFKFPDQIDGPAPFEVDTGILDEDTSRSAQFAQERKAEKNDENSSMLEGVRSFGDHVVNSFMTENIIGSTAKRVVLGWNANSEYDPSFQPTQMLDYPELVKDVPSEELKDLLDGPVNATQFRNKAIGLKIEKKARNEMSQYMSTSPISGFVGIGVASALDVTSLIPVSSIVKLNVLAKTMKGIPLIAKNMGAQISENLLQDLIQESVLTENSDIRKWDDGEILYGMVGGVVLGGAAGKFRTNKTLSRFEKLSQRMNSEKNLDGINRVINLAESNKLSKDTIVQLKQVRELIEQGLEQEHQVLVMAELKVRQNAIGKGLKDTKRLEAIKAHADFLEAADAQIALRKTETVNAKIEELKVRKQEASASGFQRKTELNKQVVPLKAELAKLKKMAKSSATDHKIKKITKELNELQKKVIKALDETNYDLKKIKAEKSRFIRSLNKLDMSGDVTIKSIEDSKVTNELELKKSLAEFEAGVDEGNHPVLMDMLNHDELNSIASEMGLPVKFKSVDDLDEALGLKFDDSLSSARVREEKSQYMKAQDVNELFNKTDPELWDVVSRQLQEALDNPAKGLASFQVNKNSKAAKIARATKLNQILTTESVVGRFVLNKSALKWSKNEFASAFYNWAAPDGVGRDKGGKLSVIETQQMLQHSYGGQLRQSTVDAFDKLTPHIINNMQLRNYLGLPSNNLAARVAMTEAYFPEKLSSLLRDEMIDTGVTAARFGDDVARIVDGWKAEFNKLSVIAMKDAKDAKVVGADMLEETKDWFHRNWDNRAAVQFDIKYGTAKMEELITNGMREYLIAEGKVITEAIESSIASQAKKFAYGLRSKDTRLFMSSDMDYQAFMRKLLAADTDEIIDPALLKREINRIEANAVNNRKKELAHRKPISLTASITIDGKQIQLRDLLETNIIASQASYLSAMAGRTASARNGILDTDLLDEWADRAVELERRRGNLDHADFIEQSMREDIESLKYGYAHRETVIDKAADRLLKMAMKYNGGRLMQYTGISSIAEMGSMIPEAGWKAITQVVSGNVMPIFKSYITGGVTGKVFANDMSRELSIATGIGLEDISFDAVLSSSRMVNQSTIGRGVERVLDNTAKAARRASAHIETIGRRLTVNALATNYGNIALGRDSVGNILGGVSNVNLVELGFAEFINGKAVKNSQWEKLMDNIRKHALDEDGKVASVSGKNIAQFNLNAWDQTTKRKFSETLAQQANHIIVTPDSTTAKRWHSTYWGAVYNQFKSFSNNAQSKVAGHNLNQALQGYKMGEISEASKMAQKLFWSAALGKLSLVTYGAIHNAGREDFSERMEQYMSVDDFRDWTRALSRSSAITGLDSAIDTMVGLGNASGHMKVEPMFDSSTIGQSRDRLSWQTTATGQLAVGTAAIGAAAVKGDMSAAGKQALKMSPFRRQLGVNQLLNAMGID